MSRRRQALRTLLDVPREQVVQLDRAIRDAYRAEVITYETLEQLLPIVRAMAVLSGLK